jgi:hypothetical protein
MPKKKSGDIRVQMSITIPYGVRSGLEDLSNQTKMPMSVLIEKAVIAQYGVGKSREESVASNSETV